MSDTVIEVENLSKKYIIGHQKQERYTALRDVIADGAKAFWRSLSGGGSGIPVNKEEFWALKDVSFEVKQGECIGIIGRNGAGKSTLLKILSRITEPTTGRIKIRGRVASLLEVGTGFHPELTGRENIFLNGSILGMSRAEIKAKFDEIVDFAEVEKFLDTPVKFYSSGMYVRLAFAVAAHLEPEILIVDEVLAVGDAAFQKKCLGKMGDVAEKEGRTVLFVSHNMEAIRRLCQKAILIKRGLIDFSGEVSIAINRYIQDETTIKSEYFLDRPQEENVKCYAYKLLVEDKNENSAVSIPVGQPWQIRVCLKVSKEIKNLVTGLGFLTSSGFPLRTVWSKPQTLEIGEYEIIFREEILMLSPGNYSIILGLSTYGITFQYIENAASLKIENFSEGIEFNLIRMTDVGLILNPLQITTNKVLS
jgi:lipopolysaccharide transport system ATP-binding protein